MDEVHGWEIQQISMCEGQRSGEKSALSRFEVFRGVKVPLKRQDQDQGHRQISVVSRCLLERHEVESCFIGISKVLQQENHQHGNECSRPSWPTRATVVVLRVLERGRSEALRGINEH